MIHIALYILLKKEFSSLILGIFFTSTAYFLISRYVRLDLEYLVVSKGFFVFFHIFGYDGLIVGAFASILL